MGKTMDWNKTRTDWQELVGTLMADIERWATEENWLVSRQEKMLSEEHLGEYPVPDLTIRLPGGIITIEAVGRNILGAEGRIDIVSFPTMNRMLLVREKGAWVIRTDARLKWPETWDRESFIKLARLLVSSQ